MTELHLKWGRKAKVERNEALFLDHKNKMTFAAIGKKYKLSVARSKAIYDMVQRRLKGDTRND